jgi:colanic acid biosynthesis protein WcaH
MKLALPQFRCVVRDTVLVSLDLLVINDRAEVLVGERRNPPAQGYLFVPGGRILKGEDLASALNRISKSEIGVELNKQDAALYGIYDHVYPDNAFGEAGLNTHYVVIACLFRVGAFVPRGHDNQHEEMRMLRIEELLDHPKVHPYTRNYFVPGPSNLFLRANELHRGDSLLVGA